MTLDEAVLPDKPGTYPTPDDIRAAITAAETGNWIDPTVTPVCWSCTLYNPGGEYVGDGEADSAGVSMGLAWVAYCAPDALLSGRVEDPVPLEIPAGYRFELIPPAEVDADGVAVDRRPFLPEGDLPEFCARLQREVGSDTAVISETLLARYRVPLAMQQSLIRQGLAARVGYYVPNALGEARAAQLRARINLGQSHSGNGGNRR